MYFSRVRIRPKIFRSTQLAKILADSSYNIHRMLWDLFPREKERTFLYREEIAREQFGSAAGVRGEPVYYLVSSARPIKENPVFEVETREYQPKLQEGNRLHFELRANPVVTKKKDRENPEAFLKARSRRQVENKKKLTKKRIRHDVVMEAQKSFLESLCEEFDLMSSLSFNPEKKEFKKALLNHGGLELNNRLTSILENDFRYSELLQQSLKLHEKLEWSIKVKIDEALENWMIKQGQNHGFTVLKDKYNQNKLQASSCNWHSVKADKGKKSGFSSVDYVGELEVVDTNKFINALFNGIGRAKAFGCGLMLVKRI